MDTDPGPVPEAGGAGLPPGVLPGTPGAATTGGRGVLPARAAAPKGAPEEEGGSQVALASGRAPPPCPPPLFVAMAACFSAASRVLGRGPSLLMRLAPASARDCAPLSCQSPDPRPSGLPSPALAPDPSLPCAILLKLRRPMMDAPGVPPRVRRCGGGGALKAPFPCAEAPPPPCCPGAGGGGIWRRLGESWDAFLAARTDSTEMMVVVVGPDGRGVGLGPRRGDGGGGKRRAGRGGGGGGRGKGLPAAAAVARKALMVASPGPISPHSRRCWPLGSTSRSTRRLARCSVPALLALDRNTGSFRPALNSCPACDFSAEGGDTEPPVVPCCGVAPSGDMGDP